MAVVDNLGREISEGLDQSAFIKQMADSLRSQDVAMTKTSDQAEQIANGSGKLPQEIADKVSQAFEKDIEKSLKYLEIIKKFCEEKSKDKGGEQKNGDSDMVDAITVLGDKLAANMGSSSASNAGGVAAGFTIANTHLASISGSSSITASACHDMAKAFLHKGSGFTHDIHCESILQDISKKLHTMNGIGSSDSKSSTASSGSKDGGFDSGDIDKQLAALAVNLKKLRVEIGSTVPDISGYIANMKLSTTLSAEQVRNINLVADKYKFLSKVQQMQYVATLQGLETDSLNEKVLNNIADVSKEIVLATEGINKNVYNLGSSLHSDVLGSLTQISKGFVEGASNGVKIGQAVHGIWGEQIKFNTALHESLYVTQGLSSGLDSQRQQYMALGREASAVAETGVDILKYQSAYLTNMKSGIKDAMTLSRVTRAGLNAAQATGMDALQTARTFGQWNTQLGLSSNQLSEVGRAVKFASQATGIMGDELSEALNTAKELAREMRNAGTLTSDAAGAFVQFSASAKKFGVEDSITPLLKTLSSSVEFYNKASSGTRNLLSNAAASVGKMQELENGTLMKSQEGRKSVGEGLEKVLNKALGQFGKDISTISELTDQQRTALNLQLESAYQVQLGTLERTVKAWKESTKSVSDKIGDINKELQNNLTQQERQALLDKRRGLTLQEITSDLTKIDEAASKAGMTMSAVLDGQKMTTEQLRKKLSDAISNVNEGFLKTGNKKDMLDPKLIEDAMKNNDPKQFRELLAGINAAEQKSQVLAKNAADPALQAQYEMNKAQAKVVQNTGRIAEELTSLLGPRGIIAMSLISMALDTNLGNALLNNKLTSLMSSFGTKGAGKKIGSSLDSPAAALHPNNKSVLGSAVAPSKADPTKWLPKLEEFFGNKMAAAAPLMTEMSAGISALATAALPFIEVIAVIAAVVVALIALFQGLEKAFENIGFDMSELTAIGEKVWDIVKKLWDGLTSLLGFALIPVAHAIKILATGISWLLDQINAGLNMLGLGSKKDEKSKEASATKSAEKSGGAAASKEASRGGGDVKTKEAGGVGKIDTKPLNEIDKNLKDASASLPDLKNMSKQMMGMFGWLAGFSAIMLLWNSLAAAFAVVTPIVMLTSGLIFLAIGGVMYGMGYLAKMLKGGFELMKQAADELWASWDMGAAWAAVGKITWVFANVALWALGLAVVMFEIGLELLAVGATAGVALALGAVALLALALLPAGIGLLAKIMTFSYNFMLQSANELWASWNTAGAWEALGRIAFVFGQVLLFANTLSLVLLALAPLLVIAVAAAAIAIGQLAIPMLALALLPLAIAGLSALMSWSIKLMVEQVNKLGEVTSGTDFAGTMDILFASLDRVIAWTAALGAKMFWISIPLAASVLAAGLAVHSLLVPLLAMALLPMAVAGMAALMSWSIGMMVEQVNKLGEVTAGADLMGSITTFGTALGFLIAWAAALAIMLSATNAALSLVLPLLILSLLGSINILTILAMVPIILTGMSYMLSAAISLVTEAINNLSSAIGGLPESADIKKSMDQLFNWIVAMQSTMSDLNIKSVSLMGYGLWWAFVATTFADRFNNAIWGISVSFMKINMGLIPLIANNLAFIDELPDADEIMDKMCELGNWILDMQGTMLMLDALSLNLLQYSNWWWSTSSIFSKRFNNAIKGISDAFSGIDLSSIQSIKEKFNFKDKLPSTDDIKENMLLLFTWVQEMSTLKDKMSFDLTMMAVSGGLGISDMTTTMVDALQRMIGSIGKMFSSISLVGLKNAFDGFSKKAIKELPEPEELLKTFELMKVWIKGIVETVIPELKKIITSLKGAVETQLNEGITLSQDFGKMTTKLIKIFDNIKMQELNRSVRGFVKSWGKGLPPTAEIKNIMSGLVQWMTDMFDPEEGPFEILRTAMTEGPLKNIGTIADAIRDHAKILGDAISKIATSFNDINPAKAIKAIEKLQKIGGSKMPNREQVISAIEQVQTFVSDASAALHRGAEGVSSSEKGLSIGQARATAFMGTSAMNADPTAMMEESGMSVSSSSQNQSTLETQIGQRLAGAEPPAGINAANQQLGEIATNTRQIAEHQRETNRLLTAVLGSLSGTGGNGGSQSPNSTSSNVKPTSSPLFPRMAFNYNGGAQKRYIQTGS
jgi:hypothetical protein